MLEMMLSLYSCKCQQEYPTIGNLKMMSQLAKKKSHKVSIILAYSVKSILISPPYSPNPFSNPISQDSVKNTPIQSD